MRSTRCILKSAKWSYCCIEGCSRRLMSSEKPTATSSAVSSIGNASKDKAQQISQAMLAYLQRAKTHDTFMKNEIAEYEIGKRHLATMMGEDPATFDQEAIDRAIEYLLPSGLFDKKARPLLKHPEDVLPRRKAAEFGTDGRPFHFLFYTATPNYYQLMHDAVQKFDDLQMHEDVMCAKGHVPDADKQLHLAGNEWYEKSVLEQKLQEKISDGEYLKFTSLMSRLISHPYSGRERVFLHRYIRVLSPQSLLQDITPLTYNEDGTAFATAEGKRKQAVATVTITNNGSGKVWINGDDLLGYFPNIADREQVMFPLQFADLLGAVDLRATVGAAGGPSGQAGAIRHATAAALQSFVDRDMAEKMRLAGLLTKDPRRVERKKPGQKGARRKFTWKKR